MKTLLIALAALLVTQVLHYLHRPDLYSFDSADDNFGVTPDDITGDLWK